MSLVDLQDVNLVEVESFNATQTHENIFRLNYLWNLL